MSTQCRILKLLFLRTQNIGYHLKALVFSAKLAICPILGQASEWGELHPCEFLTISRFEYSLARSGLFWHMRVIASCEEKKPKPKKCLVFVQLFLVLLVFLARIKRTDLGKAKTVVGTCPDMCPEKERYMRETRNQLSIFELLLGTDKV